MSRDFVVKVSESTGKHYLVFKDPEYAHYLSRRWKVRLLSNAGVRNVLKVGDI